MADRTAVLTALLKDQVSAPAAKIRGEFGALGEAGSKLGSVLHGIGAGIGIKIFDDLSDVFSKIANAIPDLISKGLSFASTVEQIQRATGATAEAASHYAGEQEFLGHSTEGLNLRLGVLSRNIIAHKDLLATLGVSIEDANHHQLDQITIVNRAREAVNGMTDGYLKTSYALKLFGRAGADQLDWLHLTNAQMDLLDKKLDALGVTMTQAMVDNARDASREGNLLNLAMQGLGNTITAVVAPAITTMIDTVVTFIQQNRTAIGQFADEVVSFVVGMVNAITGGNAAIESFTGQMNALAGATTQTNSAVVDAQAKLDAYDKTAHKAGGTTKVNTSALDDQIKVIDREITSVKALSDAQDRAFNKQIAQLDAELGRQLDLLSATERQHGIDEEKASLIQQAADAQRSLNDALAGQTDSSGAVTVDPRAVESAQRQIVDVAQRSADLQTQIADDARRDQIKGVQDYIAAIAKSETEWANKKGLLEQLKKDQATLQSQYVAAEQAGDLQKVADLTVQLNAVTAAETRATQAAVNADKTTALEKDKADAEARKALIKSVGGAQADTTRQGLVDALAAAKKQQESDDATAANFKKHMGEISLESGIAFGDKSPGLIGVLTDATLKGQQFGASLKTAFDIAAGALGGILKGLQQLFADPVMQFLMNQKGLSLRDVLGPDLANVLGIDMPGQAPDDRSNTNPVLVPRSGSKGATPGGGSASGGWVGLYGPEDRHVGELGPEYINPAGAGTGGGDSHVTINIGTINGVQTAAGLMQDFKREVERQGMRLVPAGT